MLSVESKQTYSTSGIHIFGEHYALGLNDEEVDKLLDIVQEAFKRSFGNCVVLSRPELGSQTLAESQVSGSFRGSSDCTISV